jgi:Mg2+-importing ATPase
LQVDGTGLDEAEAGRRFAACGPNALRPRRERALALQFISRFANPLVMLLLAAPRQSPRSWEMSVSFVIIVVVVALSIALDFAQEYRAGRAAERLKQSVAVRATVVRNKVPTEIPSDRIVPGEIVRLRAGSMIPADGRLLEARDLFVNQALLTGEAYPVEKHPGDLGPTASDMSAASNSVFMGTSVISGSASMLACRTGRARPRSVRSAIASLSSRRRRRSKAGSATLGF